MACKCDSDCLTTEDYNALKDDLEVTKFKLASLEESHMDLVNILIEMGVIEVEEG